MKPWLKGGLIGVGILLLVFLTFWITASINKNCILELTQTWNPGGQDCEGSGKTNIHSPYYGKPFFYPIGNTLIALSIPIILGFILGSLVSLIIGKIKSKKQ